MSVHAIQIAQAKLYDVLQGIDENKYSQIHKNARTISLFFYIENSVEEARRKLLSGVNKNNYAMPPKEERQKLIRREKELYNKKNEQALKGGAE